MGIGNSTKKEAFIAGAEDARKAYVERRLKEVEAGTETVDDTPVKPVDWLWKPYFLRHELHMIMGMPGAGKSTLMSAFATIWAKGAQWPDGSASEQHKVLWLTGEESARDITDRLKAAGCPPGGVDVVGRTTPIDLPQDQPVLEALIRSHDAGILVIDPIPSIYSPELSKNQFIDSVIRKQVLVPLVQMLEATICTMYAIEHPNKKGEETSALLRSTGSIGKVAFTRAAFVVAPEPDDEEGMRLLACTKSNYAATPPPIRFKIESGEGGRGVAYFVPPSEGRYNWTADELVSGKKKNPHEVETELTKMLVKAGTDGIDRKEAVEKLMAMGFSQRSIDRKRAKMPEVVTEDGRWKLRV